MALTRPRAAQVDFDVTNITDPLIRINSGQTGSNDKDSGIVIERGSDTNVAIIWDESADQLAIVNTTEDGSTSGNVTISSYANVKANAFYGDGSNLTGISSNYGDSDVATYLSSNGYGTSSSIIASITDSAPGTLDTLNELAAALGDDANFSTTVTNSIATKLPLAGGTMTGALTIATTGVAAAPALAIDVSSSSSFVHSQENLAANLAASQTNILVIGKQGSTKNSGYLGFNWSSSGSNDNFVSLGHWGNDNLFRVYGDGTLKAGASNVIWHQGNDGTGSGLDADLLDGMQPTSSNTANTVVSRDGSGNFSAGTITATATAAQYADLAEKYLADDAYPIGTVLEIGGDAEVTIASPESYKIVGTISENPGLLMNTGLEGKHVVPVAYIGRVPCRVQGTINRGDFLVVGNTPGVAVAEHPMNILMGAAIGKALENYDSNDEGIIEILVGRL